MLVHGLEVALPTDRNADEFFELLISVVAHVFIGSNILQELLFSCLGLSRPGDFRIHHLSLNVVGIRYDEGNFLCGLFDIRTD